MYVEEYRNNDQARKSGTEHGEIHPDTDAVTARKTE